MDRGEKNAHTIFRYMRMNSVPVSDELIETCSDGRRLFLKEIQMQSICCPPD